MKNNFNNKKIIKRGGYKFERAIETSDNIFYRVFNEGLGVGTVLMLDRKMNIIDDGEKAFKSFCDILEGEGYSWVSKKMK